MNPLKSFVPHALDNADLEPDTDGPQLRADQTIGGWFQIYEVGNGDEAWISADPDECLEPEEVA